MTDETLAIGLHQLRCQAPANPYAAAVLGELRRLYRAAGEPEPAFLPPAPPSAEPAAPLSAEQADAITDNEAYPYAAALGYQIIRDVGAAPRGRPGG